MKTKLLITLHLILVIGTYSAWLWLDYRIILLGAVLHLAMLELLRGCPLSHVQFPDDKDKRFYEWWMGKVGIRFSTKSARRRVRVFMQYILPCIIIGLAMIIQLVLHVRPVIGI